MDLGVLAQDFAASFRGIAGFRNILVLAYLDVDMARVHEILTSRLDDFAQFARCVESYLTVEEQ